MPIFKLLETDRRWTCGAGPSGHRHRNAPSSKPSTICRERWSRDSFYRFKELYDKGGKAALLKITRSKPIVKNRVAPEIEEAVAVLAIDQPAWGQVLVPNTLSPPPVDHCQRA